MMPDYQKVWNVMNDLEMTTSKICSAREILDAAVDRIQESQYDKAEVMVSAAYEYLEYYLKEFDEKFKDAWKETVVKLNEEDPCMPPWGHSDMEYLSKQNLKCDKDDPSPECKGAWNSFWEENYYPEEYENVMPSSTQRDMDKVVKWQLPVEMDSSGEYFVMFPDDLLEAANLKEGDEVEWIDNKDGSFTLRHKTMSNTLKMEEC